jgi:hypothetical protein
VAALLWPVALAAQPPSGATPEFARDVMPIIETNCLRCHNTAEQKGGLLLESYEDLMRGGDDGSPIVAGQADDSPLIRQVEGACEAEDAAQGRPAAGRHRDPARVDRRRREVLAFEARLAGRESTGARADSLTAG